MTDSKETESSGMYYLGGDVLTLRDVEKQNTDGSDDILISNMKRNGWEKVVRNSNSFLWTQPLKSNDVVLNMSDY